LSGTELSSHQHQRMQVLLDLGSLGFIEQKQTQNSKFRGFIL
jgi:hypothetical protein